jgi:hypothetical protein
MEVVDRFPHRTVMFAKAEQEFTKKPAGDSPKTAAKK